MKRRRALTGLFATVLTAGALLIAAPTALAYNPVGNCSSSDINAAAGETSGLAELYRVYGEVEVGTSGYFNSCTNDDFYGPNASAIQIGINNNQLGSFVTLGIIISNHCGQRWPASICNGARHFYAEQHGVQVLDYDMVDLGGATPGVTHYLQIAYNTCPYDREYCWYVDGVLRWHKNMGVGFIPNSSQQVASWQGETRDQGDGLGSSGNAANMGGMKTYFNGGWHSHTVGSTCNHINNNIQCVPNPANSTAFYVFTNN